MNNTERSIKYLSGDLDPQMVADFEKSLASDQDLADEFRPIERIWKIAKQQLTLTDLPDNNNREEVIASVLAAHDLERYRHGNLSSKEENFIKELEKAHKQVSGGKVSSKKIFWRKTAKVYAFVVAAAAAILYLLLPGSDYLKLADSYYNPLNDPHVNEILSTTRSMEGSGIAYFIKGNYGAARNIFEKEQVSLDSPGLFCYAISCIETGDQEKGIHLLREIIAGNSEQVSSIAKWYLSLILIERGDTAEAEKILGEIIETDDSNRNRAKKLVRRMK